MNNADLAVAVAAAHGFTQKEAKTIIDTILENVENGLNRGDEINLAGFGKFKVKQLASRQGRNPATGESITIPASRKVSFSPAKALKDSLNN